MKVPESLFRAFGSEFESWMVQFCLEKGLIPEAEAIHSPRYLARSVVPHILKLSSLFNRNDEDQSSGLDPYWKSGSNPAHLRLAYFLYFMPSNLFRVSSIFAELARLGFQWPTEKLRAIEFGAGPASGACGVAAGSHYGGLTLPKTGNWAFIEQDQATLTLGTQWAETYFSHMGMPDWGIRPFHRKIDPQKGFLPKTAPKFNLWLMSYYLNEIKLPPAELATALLNEWKNHLDDEGLIVLVEPALKLQSRRILELRREILLQKDKLKVPELQVLLPCLGHQSCGALNNPEDWCHEEVSWWRPPYFSQIDKMASLDRKSLPFTYLVMIKSRRPREEILPGIAGTKMSERHRLVSPSHSEGRELEFFLCGEEGKRRARYRPQNDEDPAANLNRGDILLGAEIRGDTNASRVSKIKKVV